MPPLDIYNNYHDYRLVDRPTDVISFDKPAADTDRFVERGNKFVERGNKFVSTAMTDNDWRPGQLVGQNGSDPATIAQSPSFAPPTATTNFPSVVRPHRPDISCNINDRLMLAMDGVVIISIPIGNHSAAESPKTW